MIKPVNPDLGSGHAGKAVVAAVIEVDGYVSEVTLESCTEKTLGKAAMKALKQWRFTPSLINGQPVRCRVSVPFMIPER